MSAGSPTVEIAASRRASVSAFPRICTTSYMPGEAVPPVSATRTGCAILPRPTPRFSASAWKTRSSGAVSSVGSAAIPSRMAWRTGFVSGTRSFAFAFGSSSMGA